MGKTLECMTLEELWQLFPIRLVSHKNEWAEQYEEMHTFLSLRLDGVIEYRMSHIGSTAIKEIYAKDIVDILLEVEQNIEFKTISDILIDCGFIKMSESENRASFNYGYTENGFADKVFHLHLRRFGDNDEIYFRDYLNENRQRRLEYQSLKLKLEKEYKYNRDAYTEAKGEFVNKYTEIAKKMINKKINFN